MTAEELEAYEEPQTPEQIMDEAIKKYKLDSLYCLFSGGKDSVCVAHYVATNYPKLFKGVLFTNVGLGSQETRKFVIAYCKEMGWKLFFTWPEEKERFHVTLLKYGWASPQTHRAWMGVLKQHTWWRFMKWRIALGESAAFISGVRKKESFMRNKIKKYTRTPTNRTSGQTYIKPFIYKNGVQLWDYFNEHELKKTPVYSWFNRSGECYCGAFAEAWELKLIQHHDPLAFNTIKWEEEQIEKFGTKKAKKYNTWGSGANTNDIENQETLFPVDEDLCGESCVV